MMLMKLRNGDAVNPEAVASVRAMKKPKTVLFFDDDERHDYVYIMMNGGHAVSVNCESFEDAQNYRSQLISEINERTGPHIVGEWNHPPGLAGSPNAYSQGDAASAVRYPTSDEIKAGVGPANPWAASMIPCIRPATYTIEKMRNGVPPSSDPSQLMGPKDLAADFIERFQQRMQNPDPAFLGEKPKPELPKELRPQPEEEKKVKWREFL